MRTMFWASALLLALVVTASAQDRKVKMNALGAATVSYTVEIGKSPSLWRKIAHYVTFGAVQLSDSIKANQPFTVMVDHDGIDTTSYTLYVNGVLNVTLPATALVNGSVSFPFAQGMPKGSYTFVARAIGPGGETNSDSLALSVTPGPPNKPNNPRIVKG